MCAVCCEATWIGLTWLFFDLERDAGRRASKREMLGSFSGRLPASTPAAAIDVVSRPMVGLCILCCP